MAQRGGARPGAGRKPGKVGAAKRALAEMAKEHGQAALQVLATEMTQGDTSASRISAATAILDRAYGKPPQSMEHTGKDGAPIAHDHSHTLAPDAAAALDAIAGKLAGGAGSAGVAGDGET